MKLPSVTPKFLFIALMAVVLAGCNQKIGKDGLPSGATRLLPQYTNLYVLAFSGKDTFLALKDPADTNRFIGRFVWGEGTDEFSGYTRLRSRSRIAITSAVFAGMLESIHEESRIVAVDNSDYISSPRTKKRILKGQVKNIAPTGEIDKEAISRLAPDLLIGYYIEPRGRENLIQCRRGKTEVLFVQNFLENHPLGRAEWIKVFGFLTGKGEAALQQFAEIEEHYLSTSLRAEEAKHFPTVLVNAPFTGIWDIPAGNSYMSRLIGDAGGDYLWRTHPGTGRIPLDIEKVYSRAADAEVWLNPGACETYDCLSQLDERLKRFSAYKAKRVYNCTKTLNEKGANNYWEYGVLRPDLVLLDLFAILHPELEQEHVPVFFEPLTEK